MEILMCDTWRENLFVGKFCRVVYIKDTKYDVFEAFLFYIYHDRIPFSNSDYEKLYSKGHCVTKFVLFLVCICQKFKI